MISQWRIRKKFVNRAIAKDTKDAVLRGRATLAGRIQPRHTEDAKRLSYGRFALRNRHSFQKLVHAQWTYGCIIHTFAILRPLRGHSARILMWMLWMLGGCGLLAGTRARSEPRAQLSARNCSFVSFFFRFHSF